MFREKYKKLHSNFSVQPKLITETINQCSKKRRINVNNYTKKIAVSLATTAVVFITSVNISPVFAASIRDVPVLGNLSKIVSIRTYMEQHPFNMVEVDQPAVSGVTDINQEIEEAISQYKEQAQISIDEYKNAFIATGGTEEEFKNKNIEVVVNYEIKSDNDKYISFVLTMYESWTSSSAKYQYYNLDSKTGEVVTLESLLGENYITIVNDIIESEIEKQGENSPFFSKEDGGFNSISDKTQFYINDNQNPVVVFDKYEIAIGATGRPEFEIIY